MKLYVFIFMTIKYKPTCELSMWNLWTVLVNFLSLHSSHQVSGKDRLDCPQYFQRHWPLSLVFIFLSHTFDLFVFILFITCLCWYWSFFVLLTAQKIKKSILHPFIIHIFSHNISQLFNSQQFTMVSIICTSDILLQLVSFSKQSQETEDANAAIANGGGNM